MAANVEAESVQLDGAADPAHIAGILLDNGDRIALLGEQIGRSQACRTRADDGDIHILVDFRHAMPPDRLTSIIGIGGNHLRNG